MHHTYKGYYLAPWIHLTYTVHRLSKGYTGYKGYGPFDHLITFYNLLTLDKCTVLKEKTEQ